jgi:CoA:oxalate CoA-transferase
VPVLPAAPDAAPLAGVRVLDLTAYLAGPFASHQLGDLGAEIVKVEPPTGDPARAGIGMRGHAPASPFMVALHRDRRSVVIDLKNPRGRGLFLELARHADVVMENFRPGVTTRLGIAYEQVEAMNSRIVYCSISGYGPDGPASDLAAIDGPVQALAGAFDYTKHGADPGVPITLTVADLAGGVTAVQAIVAALYRRERTGRGCAIDVTLFESVLQWMLAGDRALSLAPPVTQVAEGSDGLAFVVQTPLHFQARLIELIAKVPGLEGIVEDPRFSTLDARRAHCDDYVETLAAAFRTRPRSVWLSELHAAGIPAGPVQSIDDALADPQLTYRSGSTVLDAPGLGPTRVLASPYVFDGARKIETNPPPTFGEHTDEVLRDWLALSGPELDELEAQGAFGPPGTRSER